MPATTAKHSRQAKSQANQKPAREIARGVADALRGSQPAFAAAQPSADQTESEQPNIEYYLAKQVDNTINPIDLTVAEFDTLRAGLEAIRGTTPKPPLRPFYDHAIISRTHDMIVDAVSEMLSHGGADEDVRALLVATMRHTRRRGFGDSMTLSGLNQFVQREFEQWKADLVIAWRGNEGEEAPAFDGKTVSDLIRFNLRDKVWDSFREFMDSASTEEQAFMVNVLEMRDSQHLWPVHRQAEIYIATAFEAELGRQDAYLKVPEHLSDQVEAYVKALIAIEGKAA